MKTAFHHKSYVKIFLLCLFVTSYLNAQWVLKNNGIQYFGTALAMDAIDSSSAIVAFSRGNIFKTTNAGENWNHLPEVGENDDVSVSNISMIDTLNIWVCLENGKIYFSNSGGYNWTLQFSDTNKTKFMNYIEMFDINNGIAMGDGLEFNNGIPLFLKTNDGGKNWISMNDSAIGGVSGDLWRRLDFVNGNTGYFFESGNNPQKLYKTFDSGKTWNETNFNGYVHILKFYDDNFGLTFSNAFFQRTIDGGNTWDSISVPGAIGWGNDIEFIPGDPSKVWFTDYKNLFFSGDSGKTWKLIKNINGGRDIVFTGVNNGWMAADGGNVYKISNANVLTNINELKNLIPQEFVLYQNYPNPFNPTTKINYSIPAVETEHSVSVQLKVYDILGNEISTLVNKQQPAGNYEVNFNGDKFSSGIYFYRLSVEIPNQVRDRFFKQKK